MKNIKFNITLLTILQLLFPIGTISSNSANNWFDYKTAILDSSNQTTPIDNNIEKLAKHPYIFGWLNTSKFFDTAKISQSDWIHAQFTQDRSYKYLEIPITTSDGAQISVSFFNRGKGKLIVVGPGFTNPAERMAPFVDLLQNYDVAIINYRGHGRSSSGIYHPLDLFFKKLFGVTRKTKLGFIEENDVEATVSFFKKAFGYKNIVGLGICYSTLVFAKTQALHQKNFNEKLFDKLILDSAWISLDAFCDKLDADPKLIMTPQKGGFSNNTFCKKGLFKGFFSSLIKTFLKIDPKKKSILPYLVSIKDTPMLLWYGKNDLTVTRSEFEKVWQTIIQSPKVAIITSNPHVINHIKQKELYGLITTMFIEIPSHQEFVETLKSLDKTKEFLAKQYQTILNN